MTELEAIEHRHSVRSFQPRKIDEKAIRILQAEIARINQESGLHIQLVTNEPKAFSSRLARYGQFKNVSNYLVLAGVKSDRLEEEIGYYGEKLVLLAQRLGLNSCWVGLTYKKIPGAYELNPGEKIVCVIALGYGVDNGILSRSKPIEQVADLQDAPSWFVQGVRAALLAPTAVNQQAFHFSYDPQSQKVSARAGRRPYARVDLGIAKAHFETGAGKDRTIWQE